MPRKICSSDIGVDISNCMVLLRISSAIHRRRIGRDGNERAQVEDDAHWNDQDRHHNHRSRQISHEGEEDPEQKRRQPEAADIKIGWNSGGKVRQYKPKWRRTIGLVARAQ